MKQKEKIAVWVIFVHNVSDVLYEVQKQPRITARCLKRLTNAVVASFSYVWRPRPYPYQRVGRLSM